MIWVMRQAPNFSLHRKYAQSRWNAMKLIVDLALLARLLLEPTSTDAHLSEDSKSTRGDRKR